MVTVMTMNCKGYLKAVRHPTCIVLLYVSGDTRTLTIPILVVHKQLVVCSQKDAAWLESIQHGGGRVNGEAPSQKCVPIAAHTSVCGSRGDK
jgi:hypothetical protein